MSQSYPMIPNVSSSDTTQSVSWQKSSVPTPPTTVSNAATLGALIAGTSYLTESLTSDDATTTQDASGDAVESTGSEVDSFVVEGEGGSSGGSSGGAQDDADDDTGGDDDSGSSTTTTTTPPPVEESVNSVDLLKSQYAENEGIRGQSGEHNAEASYAHKLVQGLSSGFAITPQTITTKWLENASRLEMDVKDNSLGLSQATCNQAIFYFDKAQTSAEKLLDDPPASSALQNKIATNINSAQILGFAAVFSEILADPDKFESALAVNTSDVSAKLIVTALKQFTSGAFPLPANLMSEAAKPHAHAEKIEGKQNDTPPVKPTTNTSTTPSPSILSSSYGEGAMATILGAFAAAISNNEVQVSQYSEQVGNFLGEQGTFNIQEASALLTNVNQEISQAEQAAAKAEKLSKILNIVVIVVVVVAAIALTVASMGAAGPEAVMMAMMAITMVAGLIAQETGHGGVVVGQLAVGLEKLDPSMSHSTAKLLASIIIALAVGAATGGIGVYAELGTSLTLSLVAEGALSTLSTTGGWTDLATCIAQGTKMNETDSLILMGVLNIIGMILSLGSGMAAGSASAAAKAAKIAEEANVAASAASQAALNSGQDATQAAQAGKKAAQAARDAASARESTQIAQLGSYASQLSRYVQIFGGAFESLINVDLGKINLQLASTIRDLASYEYTMQIFQMIAQMDGSLSQYVFQNSQSLISGLAQALANVTQYASGGAAESAQGLE
ncbi:MAG: hypothetical protein FJZ58_03675 [Chlamydiae bacterium]|nr:hypothetical protein [Chlamydiota bacterium]